MSGFNFNVHVSQMISAPADSVHYNYNMLHEDITLHVA